MAELFTRRVGDHALIVKPSGFLSPAPVLRPSLGILSREEILRRRQANEAAKPAQPVPVEPVRPKNKGGRPKKKR